MADDLPDQQSADLSVVISGDENNLLTGVLLWSLLTMVAEQDGRIHALEKRYEELSKRAVRELPFRLIGKSTTKIEFGD